MYEDYAKSSSIPLDAISPENDPSFTVSQYSNFVPGTGAYAVGTFPGLVPIWYTDWRDETLSWHLTCSFHTHLNPSPLQVVRGPDAKRFLSENFVNDIEDFPVGLIKHGVMCLDNGLVAAHGVILRSDVEEYQVYWCAPYLDYAFAQGDYDAELVDITHEKYLFQLQGPKVLQILSEATGDDLRDIPFRGFRDSTLNGHPVRILRLGMSGGLGYEVHGPTESAREDQKRLLEVGAPLGMRQIGITAYAMNHVLGGFAQASNNFLSAMMSDPGFAAWQQSQRSDETDYARDAMIMTLTGSVGDQPEEHFFTPLEIGLGYCINWNHEFRGKAALQAYRSRPGRRMVTLEWNPDDIADIHRSQFDEEPYAPIDTPGWDSAIRGRMVQNTDYVLDAAGNRVGLSIGRTTSHFYRVMLSLAILDDGHRELGSEVFVLWGEPGTRQKKIRATVVRYPYNQEQLNSEIDATTLSLTDDRAVTPL